MGSRPLQYRETSHLLLMIEQNWFKRMSYAVREAVYAELNARNILSHLASKQLDKPISCMAQ